MKDEWDEFLSFNEDFDDWLKDYDRKHKRVPVGDFLEDLDNIIKGERLLKLLARMDKVRDYDIWKHRVPVGPEPYRKVKVMARKKDMLLNILSTLYNFLAFDHLDVFVPIKRDRVSFISVRNYYRKYTGSEPGPRVMNNLKVRRDKELAECDDFLDSLDIIIYYENLGVK